MRLVDYEYCNEIAKKEWLDSIQMNVGLRYFGGKTVIGRYIFNNIFNLSVIMKNQGKKPDIFIDAFTGGGKIGLSIPYGWYDTIIINDINYGVYHYYKYCQDDYISLIFMIEKIGSIMNKEMFNLAAYVRNFGLGIEKWKDKNGEPDLVKEDEVVDPLVAAALTYWVTAASYNGITDPKRAIYNLVRKDADIEDKKQEQQKIQQIISRACKRIPKLHEKLNNQHYIIENLDYRELIKKYNGLEYTDLQGEKHDRVEEYREKNKLWYFDPPYHPLCLFGGDPASYADTFTEELANQMVEILSGKYEKDYGKLEYFIKSDYDPQETLRIARQEVNEEYIDNSRKRWYEDIINKEDNQNNYISNLFKSLEVYPFCKVCVGGFDKSSSRDNKAIGQEFIWCRGFPEDYNTEEIE
ncbi:MAG: hypothetical protein HDR05_12370 [Lachnospiraceae bacterium]|nr:hypothetical protein [Lachnospiraceae bacterium]